MRKRDADAGVRAWIASVDGSQLYLSVLVVGEIRQGIDRLSRRDAAQARVYEMWLKHLQRDYRDRLVPVTAPIAQEWGRMNVPDLLPVVDGLMAATAKVQGLTFVTRNTADVTRAGVGLLNPFSTEKPGT